MPTGDIRKLEYAIECLHMSSDISIIKSNNSYCIRQEIWYQQVILNSSTIDNYAN